MGNGMNANATEPNTLVGLVYHRLVLDPLEVVYEILFYPSLVGLVLGPLLFIGTFLVFGFLDTLTSFAQQEVQLPAACLVISISWTILGFLMACFGLLNWMGGHPIHVGLR
jgi:hypothetical protein